MIFGGAGKAFIKGVFDAFHIGTSEQVILSADCYISLLTPINDEAISLLIPITDSIGVITPIDGDPISLSTPICDC